MFEAIHSQIITVLNSVSDQIRSEAIKIHDFWRVNVEYGIGDVCQFSGKLYRCNLDHTSQETWKPDVSPSLWTQIMYRDGIRIIPDMIESTQSFALDEIGWWGDDLYKSLIDANVYTPEQYSDAWELLNAPEEPEEEPELTYRTIYRNATLEQLFNIDEIGLWEDGNLYRSLIDNNVYTPESYPDGWRIEN